MSKEAQYTKILSAFKEFGKLSAFDLNKLAYRYSARIYEMRKDGHTIVTNQLPEVNGVKRFEYVYKGSNEA